MAQIDNHAPLARLLTLATLTLVAVAFYFAQEVLLPIALGVLLSFILSPLASRLERWKLGRIGSVIVTVALAFLLVGAIGWIVTDQIFDLAADLPKYEKNLRQRVGLLRWQGDGPLSEAAETVQGLGQELTGSAGPDAAADGQAGSPQRSSIDREPVLVEIAETEPLPVRLMRDWLGPLLAPFGTAALVIVFVIFILIKREDLRDRLIRLAGTGRVYITTQALNEAGERVSRYLLMQVVINATYGIAVAVGLWIIGLPNALLWGLLAAVLRFIPYVGPWIAAVLPIALSLAVFEGWGRPIATVGLFILLELFSNNVMEPWLYGTSTGVSVVGIIASAVFWTWLWGPIGLVLATPLTVCLTVAGRHVPQLAFLNVLLSDEPALELNVRFYQRLLAFDFHEANDVVGQFLKTGTLDELYEQMLIPALSLAEQDRNAGHLTREQQRFIHQSVRHLIDDLGQQFDMSAADETAPAGAAEEVAASHPDTPDQHRLRVVCAPAEDEADRIADVMLVQLLTARGHAAEAVHQPVTDPKLRDQIDGEHTNWLVISALAPGGAMAAREGVKQLRPGLPNAKIAIGLWNAAGELTQTRQRLEAAGTNLVATSLESALDEIGQSARRIPRDRAAEQSPADAARVEMP